MKKTYYYNLTDKKADRKLELFRHQVKKYIARERRKKLPEGFDCWNFDCKFGINEEDATAISESEIKTCISKSAKENQKSFYLEIIARPDNKSQQKNQ